MPCSTGARVAAMEYALGHIENRYVEEMVRAAVDLDEATLVAGQQCRWWGMGGGKGMLFAGGIVGVHGGQRGLEILTIDGQRDVIRYRELAQYARVGAFQDRLL